MKSVLIIDDELQICESMNMILEYEGYAAEYTTSAKEGLEKFSSKDFSAVLLDIQMPEMNGFEVLKKLKEQKPAVSVMIISAHGSVENAIKATRLGAFDFLEKPIDRDKLLISVRNATETASLKEENEEIKKSIFRVNAYKTSENFLTVTFEDITEKIKTEEALEHTLDKYKKLVEVTGAGIYKIDFVNNKFTYVNDVMCKQLGYTKEELLSMGPSDILTKESLNEWINRFTSLQRGEYIQDTVEYKAIKKNGSTMWALVTAQFIEGEDKTIIGANVVAIDITEKKLAQETIEKKEYEVYTQLGKKIEEWKNELKSKTDEKENRLQLIDAEILALTSSSKAEVL